MGLIPIWGPTSTRGRRVGWMEVESLVGHRRFLTKRERIGKKGANNNIEGVPQNRFSCPMMIFMLSYDVNLLSGQSFGSL